MEERAFINTLEAPLATVAQWGLDLAQRIGDDMRTNGARPWTDAEILEWNLSNRIFDDLLGIDAPRAETGVWTYITALLGW